MSANLGKLREQKKSGEINFSEEIKLCQLENTIAAFRSAKFSEEGLIARVCFSLSSVDRVHADSVRKKKIQAF